MIVNYDISSPSYIKIFRQSVPVYYRADLLRVIVACNELIENKEQIFIFSNLNIEKTTYDELFDEETINNLEKYNILMACIYRSFGDACGPSAGFENSFFMMKYDEKLFTATEIMIINVARDVMNHLIDKKMHDLGKLQQLIYDLYPNMFKFYYTLKYCGKLFDHDYKLINMSSPPVPSPSTHLSGPRVANDYENYYIGIIRTSSTTPAPLVIMYGLSEDDIKKCPSSVQLHKGFVKIIEDLDLEIQVQTKIIDNVSYRLFDTFDIYIPTKRINVPKSHFGA